ncbi:hypothetical protein VaNZ11_003057 [Volvox africanus]|uniref:Uncharacterized protein n=1 Tax=Volvox africanus TaxID=51714 RepID=A0ABQ5RUU5_9CHLO|nr:hypothetical protein VaNZ11_003057 [Volvox africanus]
MASLRAATVSRGCMAVSSRRPCVFVRAEGQVNPSIRKSEEKVADFVKASELPKPKAVFCRCWRSAKLISNTKRRACRDCGSCLSPDSLTRPGRTKAILILN